MGRRNRSIVRPVAGPIEPPVKTAFTVSAQAHRLLQAACLARGLNQSQLGEELILKHLAGYYVARRGQGEEEAVA